MLYIYRQQGKLPVWHLMGCETNCMVGNPGIPVVADAITKGYNGFDMNLAIKAMVESANRPDRGQDLRMKYGYIPCDLFWRIGGLRHGICHCRLGARAGRPVQTKSAKDTTAATEDLKIYRHFDERSRSYKSFFDRETGFYARKRQQRSVPHAFQSVRFHSQGRRLLRGNAWQYTWLVPHDFKGLIECFGSKEEMLKHLDSLFHRQVRTRG